MNHATRILTALACAATIVLAASPALAGYKHGGYYKHSGYGMPYAQPYRMYTRAMHPRWKAKRHKGWHRHGGYGRSAMAYGPMGYAGHGWGAVPAGYSAASPEADAGYGAKASGAASAKATPAYPGSGDIVATAKAAGSFSTLIAAVEAAGLGPTLQGEGPFTVLAPTDAAFAKLPEGTLDALLQDKAALESLLTYHVIPGRLSAADLVEAGEAVTVNGAPVTLAQLDVATADVETSNGMIHVLDTVLTPQL